MHLLRVLTVYTDKKKTVDDVDLAKLKETYAKVPTVIGSMLLTDLPLIYQPSQLAVAAFAVAGKDNGFDQQVKRYTRQNGRLEIVQLTG